MPGIDRHRVVDKSDEDLDQLMCGICKNILDEPVVTQCCQQTYCTVCIKKWLFEYDICPNDAQSLTLEQMIQAPRAFINILNKLKVKCGNHEQGCDAVLNIEYMKEHMKTCNHIIEETYHDLSTDKDKEISLLRNMLKFKITEVKDLEKQIESLKSLQTTRSMKDAIKASRQNLEPIIVLETQLNQRQKSFMIDLAKEALQQNNTFYTIARHIQNNVKDRTNDLDRLDQGWI